MKKCLFFVLGLFCLLSARGQQADTDGWFPFDPQGYLDEGTVGLSDWLDKPAGRHGFVLIENDRFVFEDGVPVKFWGTNIANGRVAPDAEYGKAWAAFLSKYGINAVRFHKFTWHGGDEGIGDENSSVLLDPEGLDRMDAFVNDLKNQGIYVGWSHIFGHRLRPGDRSRVLAYDEVVDMERVGYLDNSTYGLVMFAPDLQDLSIDLTVNMLLHRNPYTGLTYAEEPALAFVEFHNEDNIFFPSTHIAVMNAPTYKKLFCEQFSDWLLEKYGSEQGLADAWGPRALNAYPEFQQNESLAQRNIFPIAHMGYYSQEALENAERERGTRKRLLDTALFLFETQNRFYQRFEKAVRSAGYKGPLVASCWQAGSGISHYYNLYSDALIGIIDRHNYFGGGAGGHQLAPGSVKTTPMLARPGSGLLSTGLQVVDSRPFVFSEWMSLIPNEWVAEAAPLVGAYGMGLQGWDGSYSFATDLNRFSETIQTHGVYNATSPTHMTLYPALARMVHRGDVQEGAVVSERFVHVPALAEGRVGFQEQVDQDLSAYDFKSFDGFVPQEVIAAGKAVVRFTDTFKPTPSPDLDPYWDQSRKRITSETGQLAWDYSEGGFVTINTDGTKGLVGFGAGLPHRLGNVMLTTETPFAVILVSSLSQEKTIDEADRLLVTTIARARNSGQRYSEDGAELLAVGQAPVLMEPVVAAFTLARKEPATVHVLDHAGRRTGVSFPYAGDRPLQLDGRTHQAIYYEIAYERKAP